MNKHLRQVGSVVAALVMAVAAWYIYPIGGFASKEPDQRFVLHHVAGWDPAGAMDPNGCTFLLDSDGTHWYSCPDAGSGPRRLPPPTPTSDAGANDRT